MARIFSHSWQKGGLYCPYFHQQLSPHPQLSQIHTVWQWKWIQEPSNRWCIQTTWHQFYLFPYHPQNNGKLEVFYKYLKSTLKKHCENYRDNWDSYINQVFASYCVMPYLATAKTPFLLIYGRDTSLPLHQLLEPMQWFLSDPAYVWLKLETHWLVLNIAKKELDENRFKMHKRQQTTLCMGFKSETESTSNNTTWKIGFEMERWIQECPY